MDSLLHATRKIILERANTTPAQQQQQEADDSEIPDVAPPAYCAEEEQDAAPMASEDDEYEKDPSPITLTLNARTDVQGEGNLIAAPALADATRFSALLLAAVQSLNAKAEAEAQLVSATATAGEGIKVRPVLNVNIVLDCGVTIRGDRNVVGYRTSSQPMVASGLKRKADEVCAVASASCGKTVTLT